jgi:photosystem II stability/assembly factor-like uncharacterized protein
VPTGAPQIHRAVQFVDAERGWVVGLTLDAVTELPGPSKVLATSDGGATWTAQFASPRSLLDVVFVDARTGWAFGDRAAVFATSDGGATWRQQTRFETGRVRRLPRPPRPKGAEPEALRALRALDATRVWAAGDAILGRAR